MLLNCYSELIISSEHCHEDALVVGALQGIQRLVEVQHVWLLSVEVIVWAVALVVRKDLGVVLCTVQAHR